MTKSLISILLAFFFTASAAYGEDIYLQNAGTPKDATPSANITPQKGRIETNSSENTIESVTSEPVDENTNQYDQTTLTEIKFKPDETDSLKGSIGFKTINRPDFSVNQQHYVTEIPSSRINLDGRINPQLNYHFGLQADNPGTESSSVLTDAYLYTNIIPHHTVYFGKTRISSGPEETQSLKFMNTLTRSNLDDNFSSFRDVGLKVGGNWNFMDYSLGMYNGGISIPQRQDIATGGCATLKPLYKNPSLGKLEVGSGFYNAPDQNANKTTYGLFGKYRFKRYSIKGEYTSTNNPVLKDDNWWYISNTFYLTDTLKLIAKHDRLNYQDETINNLALEYAVKHNKIIRLNDLKLQINAEQITDQGKENRGRVGIKAKFSL